MPETISVRPVAQQDFPRWKELWDAYNAGYSRIGPTALAQEVTQTTWARFFDAHEPTHALVAVQAEAIVGIAHFLYHGITTHIQPICCLQDLFTDPAARGRGVGRALINSLYEHANSAGTARIYWLAHQTNTAALRLYDQVAERAGFIVYRNIQ
jgi:GNAT superfamily N-acetyltransferase